jgi:ankyrin repeat protein
MSIIQCNRGRTPLHCAFDYMEILMHLTKECNINVATKNDNGWTALHLAICSYKMNCAYYLIDECQADITDRNNKGETVIHMVCCNKNFDTKDQNYLVVHFLQAMKRKKKISDDVMNDDLSS